MESNHSDHHHRAHGNSNNYLYLSMRNIDLIVLHCSATRCDRPFPVTALIRCHADRFGFTGYHYYITRNGRLWQTRHLQLPGAHARGYNQHSIGICYEGGLSPQGIPTDTRTPQQKRTLLQLLKKLRADYPQARIVGHRDLPGVKKDCPCFDATKEYGMI